MNWFLFCILGLTKLPQGNVEAAGETAGKQLHRFPSCVADKLYGMNDEEIFETLCGVWSNVMFDCSGTELEMVANMCSSDEEGLDNVFRRLNGHGDMGGIPGAGGGDYNEDDDMGGIPGAGSGDYNEDDEGGIPGAGDMGGIPGAGGGDYNEDDDMGGIPGAGSGDYNEDDEGGIPGAGDMGGIPGAGGGDYTYGADYTYGSADSLSDMDGPLVMLAGNGKCEVFDNAAGVANMCFRSVGYDSFENCEFEYRGNALELNLVFTVFDIEMGGPQVIFFFFVVIFCCTLTLF